MLGIAVEREDSVVREAESFQPFVGEVCGITHAVLAGGNPGDFRLDTQR